MFKSSEIKQIFCKTKLVFCNSTLHKTQMLQPKVVQFFPMRINLQAKETYFWCSCGLSINQPFCDGTHQGTIFRPIKFSVPSDCKTSLCACKYNKPESGEKCDWSCVKNMFMKKIFRQMLHKYIPMPKHDDKDPRNNVKRFLHVQDTEH